MTTVYPSSAVSIVCECPYAGKTREIKLDSESEAEKRSQLQEENKQAREDLIVARNVLMGTHSKVATFRRLLSLELGMVISPYIIAQTTWRDRVREKNYLKSELVHLVDYLRECDPSYRSDPSTHPTKLSTSAEDMLLLRQEKALKKLYHDYTVYHSENEKSIGAAFWEFLELRRNYENKLHHNKIMEREIAEVKRKIAMLQRQFLEDKCMIDYVTEHHFRIKGCFLEGPPERSLSNGDKGKTDVPDSEAEKFKNLWEESRREKRKLFTSVRALRKKMESANQRIASTESVCSKNLMEFKILTRKMKEGILLSKQQPRRKENFDKFSGIHYRSQRNQLEVAINENNYLRNFLRKAILSKTDDLKQFQQSLVSSAEKYRVMLESIRSNLQTKESK